MSNISYHCPNCGSGLKFNATKGNFTCEYCDSIFDRYDLEKQSDYEKKKLERNHNLSDREAAIDQEDNREELAEYFCNNCGAHIITTSTTVATECYYCHNTVIMQKSMLSNELPTRIIPFKFDKEEAIEKFKEWIFKKTYIPDEFGDSNFIQKMQGVYFPYWMIDVDGEFSYKGKMYRDISERHIKKRVEYREVYSVEKEGNIHMEDIMLSASSRIHNKLLEGVQPFDENEMEPFTMTYLSGFLAEQKNIESEELDNQNTRHLFEFYAEKRVSDTLDRYCKHDKKFFALTPRKVAWEYSLMPVWVITYQYKGEFYYFAMNGQTGKTCGRIPIDKGKLFRNMFCVGGVMFVILYILIFILGGAF